LLKVFIFSPVFELALLEPFAYCLPQLLNKILELVYRIFASDMPKKALIKLLIFKGNGFCGVLFDFCFASIIILQIELGKLPRTT
jgi:hypothetical protein